MLKNRAPVWVNTRRQARQARWNADAHLRAHERSVQIGEQAIIRVDTCQLAANRPIEDFYSAAKCTSSSAYLFGVFDGHGGSYCSRYVSTKLFPYISAAVLRKHAEKEVPLEKRCEWLFSSADQHIHLPTQLQGEHRNNIRRFHSDFIEKHNELSTVRKAVQAAFVALDDDISKEALPDMKGQVDRLSALTAASGSCATVAHIRKRHLHVANVGDGAAVLGVSSANGGVSARQLGLAHCWDNAEEVAGIRAMHPVSESQTIFQGGRLLGELFPLRAFGDVRYKWPRELQKVVLEPLGSPAPTHLQTPPYLRALPDVLYHKLTVNDRFLVIATDGLWEWLDADTVVRLVHDHTLGAMTLQPYKPRSGTNLGQVMSDLRERRRGDHKKPIDDNCATHLIRHALGGVLGGTKEQYQRLNDILQVPPGMARSYRDDISVIVIHFDENYVSQPCDEHEMN
ncbi:unnamed protein product, partial [Mesorhabditis belari]|uniref:PPM-type phosphatase domain-containing protein n=1 Tax=Mesorhabditis belari TaxID=2138241 RepID=A0AAF3ET60_9BILA